MDFSYDDTQRVVAQVSSDALDKAGDDPWQALGEAGVLSLAVPQWLGGEGLDLPEVAIVLNEIGRRAVVTPALAALAMGVLPTARWAPPALQEELLGERLVTGVLAGRPAAYASTAYRLLLQGEGTIAVMDPSLVRLTPVPGASDLPEFLVRWEGIEPLATFEGDLTGLALAGACALGDGLLQGALELTTAHVGTRRQFGKPLSTFQSVAQQIADVYIASRTLHLATLSACVNFDDNPQDVDVAAYWLAHEAPRAMRTCHHLHGGIGLDASYPLHRYSSMLKDVVRFVGGASHRLEILGKRYGHTPV